MKELAPAVCMWSEYYLEAEALLDKIKLVGDKDPSYSPWRRSMVYGMSNTNKTRGILESEKRTSVEMNFAPFIGKNAKRLDDPDALALKDHLLDLHNQVEILLQNYKSAFRLILKKSEMWNCLKYENKTEFQLHSDANSQNMRQLTLLVYLNDDYVGGELEIPLFKVKVKPPAGSIILMPSSFPYSHTALPVEEGTKYVIVNWYS